MSYEEVDEITRARWNDECKYEERYIALLDIMGFSELVYDETYNSTFVGILGSTFTLPQQKIAEGSPFSRVKTAIISDTLVISAPKNVPTALKDILLVVNSIFTSFLNEGIVIRGGISCGKLFHQDNIVFGPAMVEAHLLEQNVAKYPRVILSPNTQIDFFGGDAGVFYSFIQDEDDIPFLDLYSELIVHAYEYDDNHGPNMVRSLVSKYLDNPSTSERIRQKYLWVREHFNAALKEQLDAKRISPEAFSSWLLSK